jgi:hypothetical protein
MKSFSVKPPAPFFQEIDKFTSNCKMKTNLLINPTSEIEVHKKICKEIYQPKGCKSPLGLCWTDIMKGPGDVVLCLPT